MGRFYRIAEQSRLSHWNGFPSLDLPALITMPTFVVPWLDRSLDSPFPLVNFIQNLLPGPILMEQDIPILYGVHFNAMPLLILRAFS